MEGEAYLDNSATTCVSPGAAAAVMKMLTEVYGNPSSLHTKGLQAEHYMEDARSTVAQSIGASDREIYFTSGGTESNNLAVFGAAQAKKRVGNRIVTSLTEHSSVLQSCQKLERDGWDVVYLPPDDSGSVSAESLKNAIDENTVLVSIMYVNNETGAVQPVDKIARIIKQNNSPALFHCDCVQAYGKIPVKAGAIKADLVTVTAHKIHGPKGVGALYVKNGVRIIPQHYGGEQEHRIRPGTQSVPLICGFGTAVREIDYNSINTVRGLNDYLRQQLKTIDGVQINSTDACLPYILNFSVPGIRSETMLHFLAEKQIYVSSGSACAKGQKSHVLAAMGLTPQAADSAVRVSFCKYNTTDHIDMLIQAVKQAINTLSKSV